MKNTVLSVFALFLLQISASAVDLGSRTSSTPYDAYLSPVKNVLNATSGEQDDMNRVRQLMHTGRAFRYSYTTPYTADAPAVTAARHAGDCKAKALWLVDQLNDANVRFVIGKARRSSKLSHAWVMWEHDSRWWILDCTDNSEPIPADRVSNDRYVPYYSFSKTGSYRHASTASVQVATTRRGTSAVAAAR